VVDNFSRPQRAWACFGTPAGAEAFLREFPPVSAPAPQPKLELATR
jgi:hypothetical protein